MPLFRSLHFLLSSEGVPPPLPPPCSSALRSFSPACDPTGLDTLVDQGASRYADLARMYQLFARVDGHGKLKAAFSAHIKKRGREIVISPEKDKSMVEDLLKFKDAMDAVVRDAFGNPDEFARALRVGFWC